MVITDRELKTCVSLVAGGYKFSIYNHGNELQWEFTRASKDLKEGKRHALKTMKRLQQWGREETTK